MKTIIAGSRNLKDFYQVAKACFDFQNQHGRITMVVSGTASGADTLGERWARDNGIPIESHPADWSKHGRSAGHIRNAEMVKSADALIAIWDGKSFGTKSTISMAQRKGLKIHIHRF